MKFIPRSFNKTRKKMTSKMNKTQKAARDKAKNVQK